MNKIKLGRIANVVGQMVPNAPGFGHARGTDNNRGISQIVKLHRMGEFPNICQVFHPNGFSFSRRNL